MVVDVIPYIEIDGVRNLKDSYIIYLYNKIIDEGHGYMFDDGSIRSSEEFLYAMRSVNCLMYILLLSESLVGLCWLNRFEQHTARVHFCMFNSCSTRNKIKVFSEALKYLVNQKTKTGEFVFDALIGTLPESNKSALKFAMACGAKEVGVIPNLCWNYITRKSESGKIIYYTRGNDNENL